jgi:RNA polymerase sigma factor (sigma-70 family)
MRDDPSVTLLLTRAQAGDHQAWNVLVERYAPLVWSICRRRELGGTDAADAGQHVWLRLMSQLDHIRDPAALPDWLATTTRRECSRALRPETGLPGQNSTARTTISNPPKPTAISGQSARSRPSDRLSGQPRRVGDMRRMSGPARSAGVHPPQQKPSG